MQIIEENGVLYQIGLPPIEEIEAAEGEYIEAAEPHDPEGWRYYSDVMTPEQIEWMRHNRHVTDEQDEEEDSIAEDEAVPLPRAA